MNFNTLPSAWDLRYFQEIAATGSLSRAAERLGVGQPALSLALKRLEDQMKAQLFLRRSRHVELTEAGRVVLSEANLLIENWLRVESALKKTQTELIGRFTLGSHASVAMYSLPEILREIYKEFSGIEIQLKHDLSRVVAEEVISGKIDFGVAVNPVHHPDLVIHRLGKDEVTFFSSGDSDRNVLIYNSEIFQSQALLTKAKGQKFARSILSTNLEVIAALVTAGCGVGILPSRVAKRINPRLRKIDGAPVVADEICLVYRADSPKTAARQAILQKLKTIQI